MIRRALCALFVGLALPLTVASEASAQDPIDAVVDRVVAGIELQVERKPESSPALLALVDIKVGDRLTLEAWRRAADRLTQVQRFQSVTVLVAEQGDGVRVIFNLEPRHPVDALDFPGDTGLPAAEIERQVRNRFGGLPAQSQLNAVPDFVRRLLQGEGFPGATVTHSVVQTHDPDRASLVVTVNAGPRAVVSRIDVQGKSFLSREQVLTRLGIAEGSPYRNAAIEVEAAKLRDSLRGQGYYTAIVQVQPAYSADGTQVQLIVRIETGPLVDLKVEGPLPGKKDDLIPIERDAAVDQDLLDASRAAIEREWRREGYWKAHAEYRREYTEAGLVITFTIDRGKRYKVVAVDMPPGLHLTQSDLQADPALKKGGWFNADAVGNSLTGMKNLYLLRGFHQVKFDPQLEDVPGGTDHEGGVIIHPNITEGPRAVVSQVMFDLGEKPTVTEAMLRQVMTGDQQYFSQAVARHDEQVIRDVYESLGFLGAQALVTWELNGTGTEAAVRVFAREGAKFTIGEINVVGNDKLSRDEILRTSGLKPGMAYNDAVRLDAQRRLYNTLAIQSARVTAEQRLAGETETRLLISIVEGGSVTLGEGAGVEVGTRRRVVDGLASDIFEIAPRAFVEISRRNLGGHNRTISVFARMGLRRRGNTTTDPSADEAIGFIEHRVTATYRSRYAFGTNTDFLLGATSEQAARTSYNFFRRIANAELVHPLSQHLGVSARYSLEVTKLFDELIPEDEQSLIDRLFPQVRLSILSSSLFWDRRNSAISPFRGGQITTSIDFAPRQLGSEVAFVRGYVEGTWFKQLPAKRVVFASRIQLGLARGFERVVTMEDEDGNPVLGPDGNPIIQVVADLPASQRFFAGGSSSVRGFQTDTLGVREIMDDNGISDGGNAMIILNAELRVASGKLLGRNLTTVAFLDSGNVFDRVGDLDLGRLRSSGGFGVRYDSPLGALRFDVGVKMNKYFFPNSPERGWAWHLSIGEVF